jgi:hypothetical protein
LYHHIKRNGTMKTKMNDQKRAQQNIFFCILTVIFFSCPLFTEAQSGYTLSGEVICRESGEAVSFANVALFDSAHISLMGGAASNVTGKFILENIIPGTYQLQVSAIGYESHLKVVDIKNENISLESIILPATDMQLNDVDVVASRIKAASSSGKTTFLVNQGMQQASNTGTDMLRLIPGVQVDLQQNISLEGSRNIMILVDGKERDRSYLSQLQGSMIDKIEIMSTPPAKYDANVTGVINIILIKERNSGMDGHVYLEVPTSESEVFLNPAYSLNYGFGRINLFTSYNGDIRYFNIKESYRREIYNLPEPVEIVSHQTLRQKTWSHRFHYGFDWFANERNHLNFYAYYNPFSQELDGKTEVSNSQSGVNNWQAEKDDQDINRSMFYSLWYKHRFNDAPEHQLSIDMSLYKLAAENFTTYSHPASGMIFENKMQPHNRFINVKVDYMLPAGKKAMLNTGFQTRIRTISDKLIEAFQYEENIFAGYAIASYRTTRLEADAGFRLEHFSSGLQSGTLQTSLMLLPNVSAKYTLTPRQHLKFNFRRNPGYPGVYQLNPAVSVEDPYSAGMGNANLQPEIHTHFNLEYVRSFNNHFISARLFRTHTSGAIRNLMRLNQEMHFVTERVNLGDIRHTGIQLSGALGFGKAGVNPYLKVFDMHSRSGEQAAANHVTSKHLLVFETGLSAYATIRKKYTLSTNLQYASPMNEIQQTTFSDALYFVSLERSFSKGLKIGVTSGLPLSKSFTYKGSEISSPDFSHYSTGKIQMSAIPLWIKLNYRFSSGEKRQRIERQSQEPGRENRKGF